MNQIPSHYLVRNKGIWYLQTPQWRIECKSLEDGVYKLLKK